MNHATNTPTEDHTQSGQVREAEFKPPHLFAAMPANAEPHQTTQEVEPQKAELQSRPILAAILSYHSLAEENSLATNMPPELDQEPASDTATTPPHSRLIVDLLSYISPDDLLAALKKNIPGKIDSLPARTHALESIAGANDENQDYLLGFELKDNGETRQIVIVSDGCGGHPGGRQASYLAGRTAAEAVIEYSKHPAGEQLSRAFREVVSTFGIIGRKYWGPNDFRATLIILIATKDAYHLGWIGDGGCWLLRQGEWLSLLTPHKSAAAQNLLERSLGPETIGTPEFTTEIRQLEDEIFMGSDGIDLAFAHDSNPTLFWTWFRQQVAEGRSPQLAMHELLGACANDPRFDDNLSVCFLSSPPEDTSATNRTVPTPANVRTAADKRAAVEREYGKTDPLPDTILSQLA